jgi:hypothetical protein
MKKLHILYILSLLFSTIFASCSYQSYTPMEAQLAPLTNDSYTASIGWNADHYNTISNTMMPIQPITPRPAYHSIIVTTK